MSILGSPTEGTSLADGRRLRSERGREAVVDALLDLYQEGHERPGAALIAERAGVSLRSVFRYFEDLDALAGAAIGRHLGRVGSRFESPAATGDVAARTNALVDQRFALYEAVAPVARAARRLAAESSVIRTAMEHRRRVLRDQVSSQFARELDDVAPADRAELVVALDAATSLDAIEYLRVTQHLARSRARAVVSRTVRALLAENGDRS